MPVYNDCSPPSPSSFLSLPHFSWLWCSYIKYLSKLKLQCSRSVCWFGGGARHWHVFISHTNKQTKTTLLVQTVSSFPPWRASVVPSFLRSSCWFAFIWNQIQSSVCYTSFHDVCLSIRLRMRTLLSGGARVHIGPLLDCGSVIAPVLWLRDQVRRPKGSAQSKFSFCLVSRLDLAFRLRLRPSLVWMMMCFSSLLETLESSKFYFPPVIFTVLLFFLLQISVKSLQLCYSNTCKRQRHVAL